MTDEPIYDPDRMTFEDLDMTDPRVVSAYFNHPVTDALVTDLGRAFRRLPAAVQRPEVIAGMETSEENRARLIEFRDAMDSADPLRLEVEALIVRAQASIDAAKLRLLELDDEP